MQLCKLKTITDEKCVGVIEGGHVRLLAQNPPVHLSDVLFADDPAQTARDLIDDRSAAIPVDEAEFLAPVDRQEVWAAGVTYRRSQEARERESAGAARFYDLVYSAPRPELFFKAPAYRVAGPGTRVHIRRDSKWNVPEPELALVLSPSLRLVGYTIGNDMSSRDIEGENPLYLPQAKIYDHACAIGPVITLADSFPRAEDATIRLVIERGGRVEFDGATRLSAMKRPLDELIDWLGRELSFPNGAILLTGTGVVPGDDFSLAVGDVIHIDITGIGRLTNFVERRE